MGGLDIFPSILDLFEQSGKFNYRIQNGSLSGQNALTSRVNGINIITLDNSYLNDATSLSITRTIIHETVHAYLLEMTYDSGLRSNSSFFEVLKAYNEKYPNVIGDTHHAAMSQFILGMSVSLYNWDKKFGPTAGTLDFVYYYSLAFGGLVKNNDPSQLIEEAKSFIPSGSSWTEIENILKNEATGNNQANGENCN